jgi:2-methylisocitrate lyase-like PEP mutase family enzyme
VKRPFSPLPSAQRCSPTVRLLPLAGRKPVNLVVGTKSGTPTVAELSQAGVKRISTGAKLYTHLATALLAAATALSNGDLAAATAGMSLREVDALIGNAQGG